MAEASALTRSVWRKLRPALEALDGVTRAVRDERSGVLVLVCRSGADPVRIADAARDALPPIGLDPAATPIETVFVETQRAEPRVRFETIERFASNSRVRIRVGLSWRGRTAWGEVTTEETLPLELRAATTAALQALDLVLQRQLGIRLVGVKQLHAFDTDLVAVSLHEPGPDGRYYVGAVIAAGNPLRAAAVAILDALNRRIGADTD